MHVICNLIFLRDYLKESLLCDISYRKNRIKGDRYRKRLYKNQMKIINKKKLERRGEEEWKKEKGKLQQ